VYLTVYPSQGTGISMSRDLPPDSAWSLDRIADALERIADALASDVMRDAKGGVAPGPCWDNPGITWPNGGSPRCELRAGHAGAHECDRGSLGGTAVWTSRTEREDLS